MHARSKKKQKILVGDINLIYISPETTTDTGAVRCVWPDKLFVVEILFEVLQSAVF